MRLGEFGGDEVEHASAVFFEYGEEGGDHDEHADEEDKDDDVFGEGLSGAGART